MTGSFFVHQQGQSTQYCKRGRQGGGLERKGNVNGVDLQQRVSLPSSQGHWDARLVFIGVGWATEAPGSSIFRTSGQARKGPVRCEQTRCLISGGLEERHARKMASSLAGGLQHSRTEGSRGWLWFDCLGTLGADFRRTGNMKLRFFACLKYLMV